ncbi:MAG: formate dehydrogenase accessory sulfurtransferase FdhD [Betaproteobacteria bacterium]|nr:formate dehydrogenase accessory sulfurtransferase FdhD [Betaproteobacteria bacterium]
MSQHPILSDAAIPLVAEAEVIDDQGRRKSILIPGERPLTVYVDKQELVTLMTLGGAPEALVLGYLKNQRFVQSLEELVSIQVDWEVAAASVVTRDGIRFLNERQEKRTITTGCGQGTIFGDILSDIDSISLAPSARLDHQTLVGIVDVVRQHRSIYKQAGSVHGCALFRGTELLMFIEDVGRHNAVDAIAGRMWLEGLDGAGLVFYTTGRLTSEMVIKGAQMGIPFLLSRSGVTQMGLDVARRVNLSLFGRCSGQHYLLYSGFERFIPRMQEAVESPVVNSG